MWSVYPYEATKEDELSFAAEELIMLVEPDNEGWSVGRHRGKTGAFPSAFVDENFVRFPPAPEPTAIMWTIAQPRA